MAAKNLFKCLDPSYGIPTDIKFLFNADTDGKVEEVKAHKFPLSLASPVFQRQFYGSFMDSEDEIKIVDASKDVFQAMIDYIYSYKPLDSETYDIYFLSSLYYLAEKYDIEDLRNEILSFIPDYPVTKDNVLEIAALAEDFANLAPLSEAIFCSAANFLGDHFRGSYKGVVKYFKEVDANADVSHLIHKIITRLDLNNTCENCHSANCLDGEAVTKDNFVPGAIHTVSALNSLSLSEKFMGWMEVLFTLLHLASTKDGVFTSVTKIFKHL